NAALPDRSAFSKERSNMARQGIGQPVRRVEDARLLTGRGAFTDDLNLDGQAFAAFARSPHAHAQLLRIDTTAALASKAGHTLSSHFFSSNFLIVGLRSAKN
ncbi:MAG: hypothetical protein ACO2ZE_08770, partial [Pseudohongiellaceae bacterium]